MDDTADLEPQMRHVYDFAKLDRVPAGETSLEVTAEKLSSGAALDTGESSTAGAALKGRSIICTLGRQPAGTGAKAHRQASEQFNYILQGTMMSDVEGDRVFASRGAILHTPAGAVHTGLACPDEDLVFFAIRDTRHDVAEPPLDAVHAGASGFPGFGSRAHEPRVSTADVIAESESRPPGPGKRYVYDMRNVHDRGRSPASAEVVPDAALRLPPGVTGKLLSGERLHVCVLRLERGASISNYRKDNEQIVFTADGELEVLLEGEPVAVPLRCVLHLPPGTRHELVAPEGALIVIAQDKAAAG